MTRKDYVTLANAFKRSKPKSEPRLSQWYSDIAYIEAALREDNARFNSGTFRAACEAQS